MGIQGKREQATTGRFIALVGTYVVALTFLAPGPTAADGTGCRESRFPPKDAWQPFDHGQRRLTVRSDVNGDGRDDLLEAEFYVSAAGGVTGVTLRLAGDTKDIDAGTEVSYHSIIAVHQVPPGLAGSARNRLREVVEDALFPGVCATPDPSLAWLLAAKKNPVWRTGTPAMPSHYAVLYQTPPKGLPEVAVPDTASGAPVWVEYQGAAHDDPFADGPGSRPDKFTVMDENDRYRLLGTHHGLVAEDKARERFAWIYVFTGGAKLGLRSIVGAALDGNQVTARVQRFPRQVGQVEIDLATGAYRETWTAVE